MLNTIRENAGMVNHQSRHASVFSVHISASDLVFCKDMGKKSVHSFNLGSSNSGGSSMAQSEETLI